MVTAQHSHSLSNVLSMDTSQHSHSLSNVLSMDTSQHSHSLSNVLSMDTAQHNYSLAKENRQIQNETRPEYTDVVDRILMVTSVDIVLPLLPFTMLPALFMAVQTALTYSTVDFLSAASLVIGIKYWYHSPPHDPSPFIPFIAAMLAFGMRVYAAFQDNGNDGSSVYAMSQVEDTDEEQKIALKSSVDATDDAKV
jgi:hypothetical protein